MEVKNNLITTIPFKGVQVRVEFTGGNSMKNIPAKFYTRDPFTQRALDSSDQLGRLYYLHQTIKEASDAQPAPAAPAGAAEAPAVDTAGTGAAGTTGDAGKKAASTKKPDTTTVTTPSTPEAPAPETPAGNGTEAPAVDTAGTGASGTTGTQADGVSGGQEQPGDKLEFENLAAAITYVASKYGEQVETDSAVRKLIADREGVKVVIHKGQ